MSEKEKFQSLRSANEEPPFESKGTFTSEDKRVDFMRIGEDENKLVKTYKYSSFNKELKHSDLVPHSTISPLELINKSKLLYEELAQKYMIPVVKTEFFVGGNKEGELSIYRMTEMVKGEPLYTYVLSSEKLKIKDRLEEIYLKLIQYYAHKYQTGEVFLNDISRADQYVVGRLKDKNKEDIYLVDTDPFFSQEKGRLLTSINSLLINVQELQTDLEVKFPKLKESLSNLLKEIERDKDRPHSYQNAVVYFDRL